MSLSLGAARKAMLEGFLAQWDEIRPTWDHRTQTSTPPAPFNPPTDRPWIKLVCSFQGGQNRSIPIRDEVNGLMTVDCYSYFDGQDRATMFDQDPLADDAHRALRLIDVTYGSIHPLSIVPRDFPTGSQNHQHLRLSLFFRFDLPEVAA